MKSVSQYFYLEPMIFRKSSHATALGCGIAPLWSVLSSCVQAIPSLVTLVASGWKECPRLIGDCRRGVLAAHSEREA